MAQKSRKWNSPQPTHSQQTAPRSNHFAANKDTVNMRPRGRQPCCYKKDSPSYKPSDNMGVLRDIKIQGLTVLTLSHLDLCKQLSNLVIKDRRTAGRAQELPRLKQPCGDHQTQRSRRDQVLQINRTSYRRDNSTKRKIASAKPGHLNWP